MLAHHDHQDRSLLDVGVEGCLEQHFQARTKVVPRLRGRIEEPHRDGKHLGAELLHDGVHQASFAAEVVVDKSGRNTRFSSEVADRDL